MDEIYVKEGYRGKGMAELLIREAEKIARKRKIKWLKARIYGFNDAARAMAEKTGLYQLYSEYFKILN